MEGWTCGCVNVEHVKALEVPLLVVAGAEDNVTDPDMARRLHREVGTQEKRLVMVEGGGHNGLAEMDTGQAAYRELVEQVRQDGFASDSL